MKKRLITIFILAIASLAVACESKPQGEEPASEQTGETEEGETEAGEAEEASGEEQADEKQAEEKQEEGASQLDIPEDQTMKGMSEGKNFYVVVNPEPNPIPFQELFELEVKVFSGQKQKDPDKTVSLDQVRATMPAHGHGMKTEPKITKTGPGTFRVEGMKFHMQGEGEHGLWVVETVVNQDGKVDQAKFEVQCCRGK